MDHTKQVFAFSDASKHSISFIAFQLEEENEDKRNPKDYDRMNPKELIDLIMDPKGPKKRFLVCFSRKLTKSEQNYSIFKLEVCAAVYGLLATKSLFLLTPIKLFVDSKGIIFLRLARNSSPQLVRLSIILSSFNVQIFHINSETNYIADFLSRPDIRPTATDSQQSLRHFTEQESQKIVQHILVPKHLTLPSELLKKLLCQDSLLTSLPGKANKKRKNCSKLPSESTMPYIHKGRKIRDFQLVISDPEIITEKNKALSLSNAVEVEDSNQDSSNQLQELISIANVFKDGMITTRAFAASQSNDKNIEAMIEKGRPKIYIIDNIKCIKRRKSPTLHSEGIFQPIISSQLLKWYSLSLHYSPLCFHAF